MSDRGIDALEAEQAVEAKLAEAGADSIRRPSFDETPEAAASVEETPAEPARNALGQFITTDGPLADETADEEVVQDATDPAVAAYLARHGGDINKAVKTAAHQAALAARQGTEVGELRRIVEELATTQQQQAQQQQPQYVDQATVDWFDEQVMTNPVQALEWARQQQNPLLVQRGLSVWKEMDPYEASVYNNSLQNQALAAQFQQQLSQQAQLPLDATVNLALQNVRGRNPQFANYDDALEATLAKHQFARQALEQAANSGDPQQIEGAIETLYSLAVGDTLQSLALTPSSGGDTVTAQDVVTPTVSETRDPAPELSDTDKFKQAFRQESERQRLGAWHVAE